MMRPRALLRAWFACAHCLLAHVTDRSTAAARRAVAQAMRLFVGDPVWTPINRTAGADAHPARAKYLEGIVSASA
jgi:cupin superfamily acireductone dioxygenase involved in methionine salvage